MQRHQSLEISVNAQTRNNRPPLPNLITSLGVSSRPFQQCFTRGGNSYHDDSVFPLIRITQPMLLEALLWRPPQSADGLLVRIQLESLRLSLCSETHPKRATLGAAAERETRTAKR